MWDPTRAPVRQGGEGRGATYVSVLFIHTRGNMTVVRTAVFTPPLSVSSL